MRCSMVQRRLTSERVVCCTRACVLYVVPAVHEKMVSSGDEQEVSTTKQILPGFETIEKFTADGFKAVMEATKFANRLPTGHSWDLYNSYPSFQSIMDAEGRRVLEIMNMVLAHQGVKGNIVMRDLEEKFDLLVDCNDVVLERVGCNLDELSGVRRNPEQIFVEATGNTTHVVSGNWNRKIKESSQSSSTAKVPLRLLTAKNIERPQIKFKDKIDNSSNPFEPRIKEKPNALKPLSILLEASETGECFSHPYEYELDLFKPLEDQLKKNSPKKYRELEDTPLVIINSPDDLPKLLDDLQKCSEIAVDLEHHSYRSYLGFTCLMQISTRDTDYVIDALELRDKLYVLNDVFTNPKIVKVFHGAICDVEWLQRDLSLYVVNMFDTHLAARMLNFVHLSLAYLLKRYCNVVVNKQFQLADWRIRPLPDELINYAREDTHYLLYVYDLMKNDLIEAANGQSNLLLSVIEQSRELCKKRYEKPKCAEDSHLDLYRKNKKMFDNKQMYAFRELFYWRDKTARQEDESTGYVLPNHMLVSIAEVLPREMQGILALCNPVPPLVRQNLVKLHQIILKARDQPLIRPVFEEEIQMRPIAQLVWNKLDLESPLHCPHDTKYQQDFREDLPTVLNPLGQSLVNEKRAEMLQNSEPHITVFNSGSESETESDENDPLRCLRANGAIFVSPYERYKNARPFIDAQEKQRREALEAERQNTAVKENGNPNKNEEEESNRLRSPTILSLNRQISKRKRNKEERDNNVIKDPSTLSSSHPLKKSRIEESCSISPSTSMGKAPHEEENTCNESLNTPKRNKGNKNKDKLLKNSTKNKPEHIQEFDYSNVDFNQFQGGSKQIPKANKKGKFKAKGKKSKFIGKSNHKSLTFGTKGR